MANTILTPTAVTREALRILHQKCNFIGNINREYDDSFAQSGARIGTALKIRLPNQYTVRTGATISTQTTSETSTTLNVTTQKGVDTSFTSSDLTMSLDDFSERILDPAMSVLAANMEADAFSMIDDVYNTVDNTTNASITIATILAGGVLLTTNLAPRDNNRIANLRPQDTADLVNQLKGLFQDSGQISKQYLEGKLGRSAGFNFYENTLIPSHLTGTMSATPLTTIALTTTATTAISTIHVQSLGLPGVLQPGDVFTLAGVNRCHPESKLSTGVLQQFVVTLSTTMATTSSISFSPSLVMSGATQNCVEGAITGAAILKLGATSETVQQSLLYHKDAFTFATADLLLPKGVHFAAREVMDGISMRVVQQYDITNDAFPTRFDVLYGYKTIRAQLACKIWS